MADPRLADLDQFEADIREAVVVQQTTAAGQEWQDLVGIEASLLLEMIAELRTLRGGIGQALGEAFRRAEPPA